MILSVWFNFRKPSLIISKRNRQHILALSQWPNEQECVSLKEIHLAFSNLVKSRSHGIGLKNYQLALKFDWRLRGSTAETPDKFQSHPQTLNPNLATSRLHEIWENGLSFF